jgi:hypothetical protein
MKLVPMSVMLKVVSLLAYGLFVALSIIDTVISFIRLEWFLSLRLGGLTVEDCFWAVEDCDPPEDVDCCDVDAPLEQPPETCEEL